MKYNELKNQGEKELLGQDKELRSELFQLKLKGKTSQLESKGRIRMVRRDIARVQTKISELSREKDRKSVV